MALYQDLQAAANTVLQTIAQNGFGELITLTSKNVSEYNPVTGQVIAGYTNYSANGHPRYVNSKEVNNLNVLQGDITVTMCVPVPLIVPQVNDVLTCSIGTFRIVEVRRTTVQGQDVVYRLQCRI